MRPLQGLSSSARIALYAIGSRLWVWAFLLAGSYFPKPSTEYWTGQAGSLLWRRTQRTVVVHFMVCKVAAALAPGLLVVVASCLAFELTQDEATSS